VDSAGLVTGTPSRAQMRAVQTPQGFEVATLLAAHERSRSLPAEEAELLTDDAMAMEAAGEPVLTVAGAADAFKVTTPMDLRVARALFGDSAT
jgi:2-C-methyl-D-erythritol 4-phosphate cytidylyltransferase